MLVSSLKMNLLQSSLVLLMAITAGCTDNTQNPAGQTAQPGDGPVISTAEKTGGIPTDEACQEWATQMEVAMTNSDINKFNELVDWNAVIDSATGGISGTEQIAKEFKKGALSSLAGPSSLGNVIATQSANGGSYRFLKTTEADGRKKVRFRFLMPDSGLNYHDWILITDPSGRTKAVDLYPFLSAELISKTLRRSFLPLVAHENRSLLAKLAQSENDYIKNFPKIQKMIDYVQNGQPQLALDAYNSLPASLKKGKNCLLLRLQAAIASGSEQEHALAIKDFQTFFPKDPCLMLIAIDGYLIKKQYDKALVNVDWLEREVGGDPYLGVLRANIFSMQGNYDKAAQAAQKAIDADPTLIDAYWSLVDVSLAKKDFDETNRLLELIEKNFLMQFNNFTQIPAYAEYVKSPQYQEWLKTHPPTPQSEP